MGSSRRVIIQPHSTKSDQSNSCQRRKKVEEFATSYRKRVKWVIGSPYTGRYTNTSIDTPVDLILTFMIKLINSTPWSIHLIKLITWNDVTFMLDTADVQVFATYIVTTDDSFSTWHPTVTGIDPLSQRFVSTVCLKSFRSINYSKMMKYFIIKRKKAARSKSNSLLWKLYAILFDWAGSGKKFQEKDDRRRWKKKKSSDQDTSERLTGRQKATGGDFKSKFNPVERRCFQAIKGELCKKYGRKSILAHSLRTSLLRQRL